MIQSSLPGFTIFGSIDDDDHHALARRLADKSGFTVLLRPLAEFPDKVPARETTRSKAKASSNNSVEVSFSDVEGPSGESPQDKVVGRALRLRGGTGSDSDSELDGVYWRSHPHSSTIRATLELGDGCRHSIRISSEIRFKKQVEYGSSFSHTDASPLTRPQVVGVVTLNVQPTDEDILCDRSYLNIGFVAQREKAIRNHLFFSCGYEKP
ncbi:hypothetical protein C8J57DRAFT_732363 [Mycena rebaudengoi]|nr:hypothetical protein C8J57DRAFT_732363 [Mycena rebaudengoi]